MFEVTTKKVFIDILHGNSILIGGMAGSGKSVVINNLMLASMIDTEKYSYILIDPKRVELIKYKHMRNTLRYADSVETSIQALEHALELCEKRYKLMQRKHLVKWKKDTVLIVIDELADLMTTDKKRVIPLIQRIGQIGRAARVIMIAATQTVLSEVVPTKISCNFDTRIGLRVKTRSQSQLVTNTSWQVDLPPYGQAVLDVSFKPDTVIINIPLPDDQILKKLVKSYTPLPYRVWI